MIFKRSEGKLKSDLLNLTSLHGRAKVGHPTRTYLQQLCTDTVSLLEDLPEAMYYRDGWRG